jgi:hypothetical protein
MYSSRSYNNATNPATSAGNLFGNIGNLIGEEGIKTKVTVSIAPEEFVKLGATIVGAIWIAYLGTTLFGLVFKKN